MWEWLYCPQACGPVFVLCRWPARFRGKRRRPPAWGCSGMSFSTGSFCLPSSRAWLGFMLRVGQEPFPLSENCWWKQKIFLLVEICCVLSKKKPSFFSISGHNFSEVFPWTGEKGQISSGRYPAWEFSGLILRRKTRNFCRSSWQASSKPEHKKGRILMLTWRCNQWAEICGRLVQSFFK